MSAWAYIAFPFFVVASMIEMKLRWLSVKFYIGLAVACIIAATVYFTWSSVGATAFDYLAQRFLFESGSSLAKREVYDFVLHNPAKWLPWGASLATAPCHGCSAPQDAGVFVNYLYYFGIPFVILGFFVLLGVLKRFGVSGLIFFLPIVGAKYFVWDPIILFILIVSLVGTGSQISHECDNQPTTPYQRRVYRMLSATVSSLTNISHA
jgi:hypothetical protein